MDSDESEEDKREEAGDERAEEHLHAGLSVFSLQDEADQHG